MLQQIEESELLKIVGATLARSPFYQKKFAGLDLSEFARLPFTTKRELLADQELHPPFGSNLCVAPQEIVRIHRTSGTSNKPLLLTLTQKDIDVVTDIGAKLFGLCGMQKGEIVFNCLNYNMWMGGYTDHQSMEKSGAGVIPFGTGNTDALISLMREIPNASLHSTPSYLSVIKERLAQAGLTPKDLRLKNGFFAAEGGIQNPEFRKKIEDEWGIDAYNANYGLSEVISILGSECRAKTGLHFGALSALYIELIDAQGDSLPIKEGSTGELVITHLHKEAQPLIRYRTGDLFEILSLQGCSCGFEGFQFAIRGRVDDMVVIKGVNFFPESLRSIIADFEECSGLYKLFVSKQEPIEHLRVLIETKQNCVMSDQRARLIAKEIKSVLNVSADLEFTPKLELGDNKIKILERV
ncbi:MAG: phenylacetate--CoA ligase family protein [Epsilonproteobacteria bacterium]|nr:phenylacetate--CoA ligase family protein [Campylobacterota bacterium]